MNLITRLGLVTVFAVTAWAAEPTLPPVPERGIVDGVFVSESTPELQIRIDDRFRYLGRDRFVVKGIAHADRHHWVAARDGVVQAMIVLQFEGFLEGVDEQYRYRIPPGDNVAGSNYRFSTEAVVLGGAEYIHNTWAYDNAENARKNPGAEADRTRRFLTERGYRMDDEVIMSRWVRVVGEERRDELIVFYIEPLAIHGHRVEQFPDGGPVSDVFDRLSERVTRRARESFDIFDLSVGTGPARREQRRHDHQVQKGR